jgi:hypothetical protein
LLFLLQEGLEVVPADLVDEAFDPLSVLDPAADGVMECPGDVSTDLAVAGAGVKVERRVLLALLATAVGLATGAESEHEGAAKERFVGEDLGGPGACVSLLAGALST